MTNTTEITIDTPSVMRTVAAKRHHMFMEMIQVLDETDHSDKDEDFLELVKSSREELVEGEFERQIRDLELAEAEHKLLVQEYNKRIVGMVESGYVDISNF